MKIIERLKKNWFRRLRRYKVLINCDVREFDRLWEGTILNLSLSGAKIQVGRVFDRKGEVSLYIRRNYHIVPVDSVVMRTNDKNESFYLAVKFHELNSDSTAVLNDIIERRKE